MTGSGDERKRPRGDVRAEAEIEERTEFVAALMVKFPDRESIVSAALASEYRIAPRTCDRYMASVRARWAAETAEVLSVLRARHRRNLARLRALAEAKGKWSVAAKLAIEEAKIDGVSAPVVLQLGGSVQTSPTLDLSKLSDEQLVTLEGLMALASGPRGDGGSG